jgi:eukaryotic-like serine/threonine-protein kinase
MAQQWYYSREGKEHGPLSPAVLFEMAKTGDLLPTDLLRREGTEKQRPAADFPKLFAKGGTHPSQAPQRDSPPSETATAGRSVSRSAGGDPVDVPRGHSIDPPLADPSSLKGLTMALGMEPAEPGRDPLLGSDIGGVTIVRMIAEGGMGRVYEGRQQKPGRTVAVKVMRPGLTSPSLLKRFEYETEVLGRLQNPGIAQIYAVGIHRIGNTTVPYFIMEYIAEAKPLTKYADDLKLPTRQRLDLFRSVCEAVAHGHHRGVIHRDLKPNNILVDASGLPKVIDFGVARATDSDMALTTMQTDVGQLIGTLQYMSPEQFDANPNDIDIRSDVYALGVILYQLLTGKPPYDVKKKAVLEVMRIVKEEDPTPISSLNKALRGDVAVIAGKCLEKDRGRRYSSASELGADIGRYLSGDAIMASPPVFLDGLKRLAKKHRMAAAAAVGIVSALVLAVAGISVFATRAEGERQVALQERDRANAKEQEAEESRRRAETEKVSAEKARAEAEERRTLTEASEVRANQEARNATQRLYQANLYRIQELIKEHNLSLAWSVFKEATANFENGVLPIEIRHLYSQLSGQAIACCEGHRYGIGSVAFSPDGARLVTGSCDNTARLWDVASGKQLAVLQSATSLRRRNRLPVSSTWYVAVAFSPDGTRVATGSRDKTAGIWDVATGNQVVALEGHLGNIGCVAFSPDGTRVATGSPDKTARLWDVATGNQVAVLEGHLHNVGCVAFSPDGTRVATGSPDKTARLWDVATGKQLALIEGHSWEILSIAFSPDGTRLATVSSDNRLWDVATGKQLAVLPGDGGSVTFSPDGMRLATGGEAVRLWDTASGKQLAVMEGHSREILAIAFSPDGQRLATGSRDNTARLWDVATRKQVAVMEGHNREILSIAFSPDGTRVATGSRDNTARLWDVASGKQPAVLEGHRDRIEMVAFSPDGTRLATGGWDNRARLWDVATGNQLAVFAGWDVAFSPDGMRLATRVPDNKAVLWDTASGKELVVLESPGNRILSITLSPDGTRLATRLADNKAVLWDTASGKELVVLEAPGNRIFSIAFSPDGTRLATGSEDKTARLWDVATGKQLVVMEGHAELVKDVAFSPDGTRLATGSEDKTAWIWDAATGKQLAVMEGHTGSVKDVAFSPDGTRLATLSRDGTARLWDVASGKQLAVMEGHSQEILSIAFSPDGMRVATGSEDATARLWDVATGKQLAVLEGHKGLVKDVAFSPDGTRLATASADRTARIWGVSNAKMYQARRETEVTEHRLDERVTAWLRGGPDVAVGKLKEAKASLSPEEYRVAGNMILSRLAARPPAVNQK